MDVLSEVLAICRAEHAVTARFHLSAPWGLASAGVAGSAVIRMARGAPWWIALPGADAPLKVDPGDLVLLPAGSPHRITSSPDAPVVPFAQLLREQPVTWQGSTRAPLVDAAPTSLVVGSHVSLLKVCLCGVVPSSNNRTC